MSYKQCFKCEVVKHIEQFYTHPRMADGHLGKCKECTRLDAVRHRAANLDKVKAYDRGRSLKPHRIDDRKRRHAELRRSAPVKYQARCEVSNAIRDGRIAKQPCEVCGGRDVTAHHDDYSRPLDVRWLCWTHHGEQHRKYDYSKLTQP
jgi:hypothetical protein